jgi:hypothetical protein
MRIPLDFLKKLIIFDTLWLADKGIDCQLFLPSLWKITIFPERSSPR